VPQRLLQAAPGNLNTTQPEAVQVLKAEGVTVIGGPTKDGQLHGRYLGEVIAARPDLIRLQPTCP
jgi:adenosylhomocysteinase